MLSLVITIRDEFVKRGWKFNRVKLDYAGEIPPDIGDQVKAFLSEFFFCDCVAELVLSQPTSERKILLVEGDLIDESHFTIIKDNTDGHIVVLLNTPESIGVSGVFDNLKSTLPQETIYVTDLGSALQSLLSL